MKPPKKDCLARCEIGRSQAKQIKKVPGPVQGGPMKMRNIEQPVSFWWAARQAAATLLAVSLALPLAQEALTIYEKLRHRDMAETRALVERLKKKVGNE